MRNNTISSILLTMAGIITVGLIFHWNYETWRVIDIAIIGTLIYMSVRLYKGGRNEPLNPLIRKRIKKIIIAVLSLAILGFIAIVLLSVENAQQRLEARKCQFTLSGIKENIYHRDQKEINSPARGNTGTGGIGITPPSSGYQREIHETYWEIDGLISNDSNKPQRLRSMIAKIYTADDKNILLAEGYKQINEILKPNQTQPFQVRAQINRDDPVLGKYFDKDDEIRLDVYPWFSTCE